MKNATVDHSMNRQREVMPCVRVPTDESGPLKEIWLCHWGRVKSLNGTTILIDDEGVAAMVAELESNKLALPIDREHGTLAEFQTPNIGPDAFGHIEKIVAKPGDGLYAMVDWTADGIDLIRRGKFRYISPVFELDKETRRAVSLHSAGLTNKPAITNQPRVAASRGAADLSRKESEMDKHLKALIAFARSAGKQLADNADVDTVVNAVTTIELSKAKGSTEAEEVVCAVRKALSLGDKASTAEVVTAVNTLKHNDAANTAMKAEFDKLKEQFIEEKFARALEPHIKANRHNPKDDEDRKWLLEVFTSKGPEFFEKELSKRGPNPPAGQTQPPSGTGTGGASDRATVINKAKVFFVANQELRTFSSVVGHVEAALYEARLQPLTDEEKKSLAA